MSESPKALTSSELEDVRPLLFEICKSKEELRAWIHVFLGLDIPDGLVDPTSTISPMGLIWKVYSACVDGREREMSQLMAYASRASMKTLAASIIEALMLLHLERNSIHLAAIKEQSSKSQEYLIGFLNRPILREFVTSQNDRNLEVTRYRHTETKTYISPASFKKLDLGVQNQYQEIKNYCRIVVCSVASTNGQHAPFMCVSGDTEILIRGPDVSHYEEGAGRVRRASTAMGIFRQLEGRNPGGRGGGETVLEITEPKRVVEVLSCNFDQGIFEFKPITRAHRDFREVLEIATESGRSITCTPDHPLYVDMKGFVQAKDLKVGVPLLLMDRVPSGASFKYKGSVGSEDLEIRSSDDCIDPKSSTWEQVILGSLLGDMGIYRIKTHNPYVAENHGLEQKEYMDWKWSVVGERLRYTANGSVKSGYTGKPIVGYYSGNSPLLMPYKDIRNNLDGIEALDARGLAIWYMDDGMAGNGFGIATHGWSEKNNQRLSQFLKKKFEIETFVACDRWEEDGESGIYYYLRGGVEAKRRLVELCLPYIHHTMAYKFDISRNSRPCKKCGQDIWFYRPEHGSASLVCQNRTCRVAIKFGLHADRIKSIKNVGQKWVYDFTVADNHNFFSNWLLSKNCVDEIEVVRDKRAYKEAKMIPSSEGKKRPITLYTSTRKQSTGLVQKEIDDAHRSGMIVEHWNILDATKQCPPSRHRPELPPITIYSSDSLLKAISETEYEMLNLEEKKKYERYDNQSAGCIGHECKLFAACKGNLKNQIDRSFMLREIEDTQIEFQKNDVHTAKAQLLCWLPSREGMVYPNLERIVHCKTAAQIATMITGEDWPDTFSKSDLISLIISKGYGFGGGMDYGFSHNFATCYGVKVGENCYILGAKEIPGLEPTQQIAECDYEKELRVGWYADTSQPGTIKMFHKAGHVMRDWKKTPGSVMEGINIVRTLLMPAMGAPPRLFFLKDDEGVELLVKRVSQYHWMLDSQGNPTDIPDEENDDLCDSIRYYLMNTFKPKGKVVVSIGDNIIQTAKPVTPILPNNVIPQINQAFRPILQDLLKTSGQYQAPIKKKGKISW